EAHLPYHGLDVEPHDVCVALVGADFLAAADVFEPAVEVLPQRLARRPDVVAALHVGQRLVQVLTGCGLRPEAALHDASSFPRRGVPSGVVAHVPGRAALDPEYTTLCHDTPSMVLVS